MSEPMQLGLDVGLAVPQSMVPYCDDCQCDVEWVLCWTCDEHLCADCAEAKGYLG